MILLSVLTLLLSTSLISCNRKKNVSPAGKIIKRTTVKKNSSTPRSEANARKTITLKEGGKNTGKSNTKVPKTITGAGTTSLMQSAKGDFVYPIDFRIGSLEGFLESGKNSKIARKIESFFSDFKKGKVEEDLIYSEIRSELTDTLKYHISQKHLPVSFRIGVINIDDGKATANIRLFSKIGSSEGEIYLEKKNNDWYITGLQLDLNQLSVESNEKKEKFSPSPYNWMLEGL